MGSNFTCMFLMMILQVWWNLVKFEKMLKYDIFCKFDEIYVNFELWKNVEISWYFKGPALSVSIFLWNKSTFLNWLKFHMHVSDDDSNMFCKFDEIWWTLKKCWNFMIFLGPALSGPALSNEFCIFLWNQRAGTVSIFLLNKFTSLNGLKFHMHVSDDDSNMFCKFDEIWWTLKKCWNFMIFLGPALLAFFYEIS